MAESYGIALVYVATDDPHAISEVLCASVSLSLHADVRHADATLSVFACLSL